MDKKLLLFSIAYKELGKILQLPDGIEIDAVFTKDNINGILWIRINCDKSPVNVQEVIDGNVIPAITPSVKVEKIYKINYNVN